MPGSNILHMGVVRTRCVGIGNLDYQFLGYDNIYSQVLTTSPMSTTASRELNRLCNFQSQASRLKGSTDELGEVFRINKIIIFAKQLWTDYPG